MNLSQKEIDLIEAIRNFKKSQQHNASVELEWFIRELFERLLYGED